jgi:catechol 2,3-dioxygenase-like lactoylglutathione lyase family enzyme
MATIRYVAFISEDPAQLSDFYHRFLGTQEIGRSTEGDVSITDGFYNITLFRKRRALKEPSMELGLHHVGLEVENLEEVKARYLAFNPRGVIVDEPADIHHGEIRIYDPECHPISLSTRGFGVRDQQGKRFHRIRHVAYNALDPERMLLFYTQVFGLRELPTSDARRQQGLANRFGGDGATNLAVHPFYSRAEGHEPRFGINHLGFLVNDLQAAVAELTAALKIEPRPSNRPYAEFRFRDPEGNALDLSQTKGWEVDIGRWEKAGVGSF